MHSPGVSEGIEKTYERNLEQSVFRSKFGPDILGFRSEALPLKPCFCCNSSPEVGIETYEGFKNLMRVAHLLILMISWFHGI
jgi:hypothetical protein